MKTLVITIFDEKLFNENKELFNKFRKLYYGLENTKYIDITPDDSIIDKVKNHGDKPDFVIIHCCCNGVMIQSVNYPTEHCVQASEKSVFVSINAIKQIATDEDSNIPIISFMECGRERHENIPFVKPPHIVTPIHGFEIDVVPVFEKISKFTNEFSNMLYDSLSDFRMLRFKNLWVQFKNNKFYNGYKLELSHIMPSRNESHIINKCVLKLFKKEKTKTLIITVFDRELFKSSIENFDRFEKLFKSLNVKCINIRKDDNIIEKIKKSDVKPDFVILYCCCRGAIINNENVIQMTGNLALTSVDAIINTATSRNANVPVFMILECGTEKYKSDYVAIENCVKHKNLSKYHLLDNMEVSNIKFQDLLYTRLIEMDKITSNNPFSDLDCLTCCEYDDIANLCFIQSFSKK